MSVHGLPITIPNFRNMCRRLAINNINYRDACVASQENENHPNSHLRPHVSEMS